jgi:hypothetical protein
VLRTIIQSVINSGGSQSCALWALTWEPNTAKHFAGAIADPTKRSDGKIYGGASSSPVAVGAVKSLLRQVTKTSKVKSSDGRSLNTAFGNKCEIDARTQTVAVIRTMAAVGLRFVTHGKIPSKAF